MKTYFDLRDELQGILGRPVELVMEAAIRDPLFREEANRTREMIYAAAKPEAA
jgi:predicted nucleotidyltransferase